MTAGDMNPTWTPCKHSQTTVEVAANLLATASSSDLSSRTILQPERVELSSHLHVYVELLLLSAGCVNIARCRPSAFCPGRNASLVQSHTIAQEGCWRFNQSSPSPMTMNPR
ncbi:hypothetical protein IG631_01926 [Alternaria alternata]|nr:hypothetical protein IG631_01926 [Alternaria alternata]